MNGHKNLVTDEWLSKHQPKKQAIQSQGELKEMWKLVGSIDIDFFGLWNHWILGNVCYGSFFPSGFLTSLFIFYKNQILSYRLCCFHANIKLLSKII